MSEEKDFLREHAGRCVFPLVETGRKELCNAMTFKVDGSFPPFCEAHTIEVRRTLEHMRRKVVPADVKKKRMFRGGFGE